MERILIIGEEVELHEHLKSLETAAEIQVHRVARGGQALEIVETVQPAIAFVSESVEDFDSVQLLLHLREVAPDLETIYITTSDNKDRTLEALESGACDVMPRRASAKALQIWLHRAREKIWMRRRLQDALEEIQKRHNFEYKLIHTSMDGIIANDREGRIIVFNEGASRIYGFSPEEALTGLHVTRLYPEGEARRIKKKIYSQDHGGTGRLINYETQALTSAGRLVPILLSATLIHEDNREVATVGYFKDLTGFKRSAPA